MEDYKYVFECPTKKGYTRLKISRKDFTKIIPNRKINILQDIKMYRNDRHIIIHYIPSLIGCILTTLLLPFVIILGGVVHYKQAYAECISNVYFAEKLGKFVGDDVYKRDNEDNTFDKLVEASEAV